MHKEENIVRNKARLVIKRYYQQEGIDYEEIFAPVPSIKVIQIFMAYAAYKTVEVYQMDVKCTFHNCIPEDTVYVEQPLRFINNKYPDHYYILNKDVYGLKQASRAWYTILTNFLKSLNLRKDSSNPLYFVRK